MTTRYLARDLVTPGAGAYRSSESAGADARSAPPAPSRRLTSGLTTPTSLEPMASANSSRGDDIDLSLPIVAHAWHQIANTEHLPPGYSIDRFTRDEILRFLTRVADGNTVFPIIASDGDGTAIAQWNAGDASIIIQFDYTGPILIRAKSGGRTNVSTEARDINLVATRTLRTLTRAVEAANPDWRGLFL